MAIGTAGFTAMLCVQANVDAGIKPEDGEILVTGASIVRRRQRVYYAQLNQLKAKSSSGYWPSHSGARA